MNHQTPMTCIYGYSHLIHLKTVATELEIHFLSTWIYLWPQCHSCLFLFKRRGCPNNSVHIMNVQVRIEKGLIQTVAIKLEAHNSLEYHYMLKH